MPRFKVCPVCRHIMENEVCPACGVRVDFTGTRIRAEPDAKKVLGPIAEQTSPAEHVPRRAPSTPWLSGSFYLVLFVLVFILMLVAAKTVPLEALPMVISSAFVAVVVIAALQLRHDRTLSEKGFLAVIRLALHSLPNIGWEFAKRLLRYAIVPLGLAILLLAVLVPDPRMSVGTLFWVFLVLIAGVFIFSLSMISARKHQLWKIFYYALTISIIGFALVCWTRYLSALASIVTEASVVVAVVLVLRFRKTAITRYGRNRRLVYLAFVMIALLPLAAIIPHLTLTPTVVVSPLPKSVVLQPGATQTIDLYVATAYGSAWHIELTTESPELLAVYLDHKEGGPLEIPFLEQGQELDRKLRLQASPLIANGTYEVKVGIQYMDAIGEIHSASTNVQVVVGPAQPSPCIIATATFGSEVSPDVDFLRSFRDRLVLSTKAGSAFMQVFNAWYYSFSPFVARAIAANEPVRTTVRVTVYPLLSILRMSASIYSTFGSVPEFAVVMAGLIASSFIGLVYLTPLTFLGMRTLTKRRAVRTSELGIASFILLACSLVLLIVGELAGSFLLLAIASSTIVLVCLIMVPTIVAAAIFSRHSEVPGDDRTGYSITQLRRASPRKKQGHASNQET